MPILQILTSMRGQPQSDKLDARVIKSLKSMTVKSVLDLSKGEDGALMSEDIINLFRILKRVPAVTNLNLAIPWINLIGPWSRLSKLRDIITLAQTLKTNSTVKCLNLTGNEINDIDATALAKTLETNITLTSLILDHNYIHSDGANTLAQAMTVNITLTTLHIKNNLIKDVGANSLAEALKTNTSLTNLNLKNNCIDDMSAIGHMLELNSTLKNLNLKSNIIHSESINFIAYALKINKTLLHLSISIYPTDIATLSEALKCNTTLTSINILANNSDIVNFIMLAQHLVKNLILTTFKLTANHMFHDFEIKTLAEFIRSIESRLIIPRMFSISDVAFSQTNKNTLSTAFTDHANRMHQRATTLGEALHPRLLPLAVATLVGQYANVTSTLSLFEAFQRKQKTIVNKRLKIKQLEIETHHSPRKKRHKKI